MTGLVAECLGLRRWALPLLARSVSPEDSAKTIPTVSPRAWALFLAAETVSRPLAARLGQFSALLPTSSQHALRHSAREEAQRVMAARAQLANIDQIAEWCALEPVVLKGGVHAADGGEGFDLGDLDLLLDSGDVVRFRQALVEQGGYRFHPRLDQLKLDGAITVELHDHLEVGYGIELAGGTANQHLAGFQRLGRLAPAAHVAYCIQHTTTKHPLRRGHLRDVLLIADALDDCSAEELVQLETALRASRSRDVYLQTLTLARSLQPCATTTSPVLDPFTRFAAGKYATSVWFPSGSAAAFPLLLDHIPHFVAPPADAWRLIVGYLGTDVQALSRWNSPLLSRVAPRLAIALGTIVRTPYRIVALAYALIVGVAIRILYALVWRSLASPNSKNS